MHISDRADVMQLWGPKSTIKGKLKKKEANIVWLVPIMHNLQMQEMQLSSSHTPQNLVIY